MNLVFNGHAHIYQRNVAPPGGVISYVSGGGGARSTSVSHCSTTDAYAIGWSYSKNKGSACGAATVPASDAQVYHFLKVTVNGSTVTVTPTDSQGHTFDVQTYNFGSDTTAPSAPGGLGFVRSSAEEGRAVLDRRPPTTSACQLRRLPQRRCYLATMPRPRPATPTRRVIAGQGYTYQVVARDLAGNTDGRHRRRPRQGWHDTTAPTAPTGLTGSAASPTTASLSWNASTDDVGVTSYAILRGGVPVATVGGTTLAWSDTGLTPGTDYTYQVVAYDAAGNASAPGGPVTVTTQADTSPPTAPGTPTGTGVTSTQVGLSWTASTDNVGVLRYDVLRDGAVVATAAGTTFTDTTVAPGTTYTYAVRAYDAAGNSATSGSLGGDHADHRLGLLRRVRVRRPVAVEHGQRAGGEQLHRAHRRVRRPGDEQRRRDLRVPDPAGELHRAVDAGVGVRRQPLHVGEPVRLPDSTGGSIVNLYLDTSGRVSLRNNIGGVTTYSTTVVAAGAWHRFVLHAIVNGTSSSVDVSMDGTAVPGLTLTGQDLGTIPIAKLQLGETTTGRTYDIVLDDVTVAQPSL